MKERTFRDGKLGDKGKSARARAGDISRCLSRSDLLFLRYYSESKSITDAGIGWAKARGVDYTSRETACCQGSKKIRAIRAKVRRLYGQDTFYELIGLGLQNICRVLREALSATTIVPLSLRESTVITVKPKGKAPHERVLSKDRIVEAGPYPDHRIRVLAAEKAARLRGDLIRPRENGTPASNTTPRIVVRHKPIDGAPLARKKTEENPKAILPEGGKG